MPRARLDKDYYAILGVRRDAVEEEIRKAYRRLALEWHPDRRPDDPRAAERFKEVSEAYAVLINPARRREYDEVSRAGGARTFRPRQDDLFRDLFTDPRASTIFEDLAREFERMGMRVDARSFRHTLFGGRAVVTGGVFVISPLTVLPTLLRVARVAVGGARAAAPGAAPEGDGRRLSDDAAAGGRMRPRLGVARGLLATVARAGRRFLAGGGAPSPIPASGSAEDVTLPLHLTRREAEHGGERRVTLTLGHGAEDVSVTIPRGIRRGMRLRLR